jgi:hypothetical protein
MRTKNEIKMKVQERKQRREPRNFRPSPQREPGEHRALSALTISHGTCRKSNEKTKNFMY